MASSAVASSALSSPALASLVTASVVFTSPVLASSALASLVTASVVFTSSPLASLALSLSNLVSLFVKAFCSEDLLDSLNEATALSFGLLSILVATASLSTPSLATISASPFSVADECSFVSCLVTLALGSSEAPTWASFTISLPTFSSFFSFLTGVGSLILNSSSWPLAVFVEAKDSAKSIVSFFVSIVSFLSSLVFDICMARVLSFQWNWYRFFSNSLSHSIKWRGRLTITDDKNDFLPYCLNRLKLIIWPTH